MVSERSPAQKTVSWPNRLISRLRAYNRLQKTKIKRRFQYGSAWFWTQFGRLRFRIANFWARKGTIAGITIISALITISFLFEPRIQKSLAPFFGTEANLDRLSTIYVTLGGALLAASAIVFSLVMFAIQVNIERLPHGLFRALGLDKPLFLAFIGTFFLAVVVSALSVINASNWVGASLIAATWCTFLVPIIFLYAYRRAMKIVNPLQQLRFVFIKAKRELDTFVRHFERVRPFIKAEQDDTRGPFADNHDYARIQFFQMNPDWLEGSKGAITYVVAISKRAAQNGDHQVAGAALHTLVNINAAYVSAKGRTFFTQNFLLDNPLTSDKFINDSLEYLRQMMATGLSNGDEIQISQIFRTFASLAEVYRTIDYGVLGATKTHAHLAAHYLGQSVSSVIPHKMADVLMDGVNIMGVTAKTTLTSGDWEHAPSIYENIFKAAIAGAVIEEYRPVTQTSMSVFAELAFELLRTRQIDAESAAEKINENIVQISKIYLATPDMPLISNHATALGPYFSVTVFDGFCSRLRVLANSVLNAEAENEDAKNVIRNMGEWSGTIARSHGVVLELAIEKRSFLTQHISQWTEHVVTALMAVAWAPACSERERETLWENSTDILDTLNVSPQDRETAGFLNNFQWNETIFDIATVAWQRDADIVFDRANHVLTRWAFVAGRFQTGWGNFERSILGLAALATLGDDHQERRAFLLEAIRYRLDQPEAPSQELLDRTARELRGRANNLRDDGYRHSSIENAVGSADPERMRPTLIEIADLISPGTIGQASDRLNF